jgi:CP12 domain
MFLGNPMADYEKLIQQEKEEAKKACEENGPDSAACAVALDNVEELREARARAAAAKPLNSLEQYCDANPDALECRVYDD